MTDMADLGTIEIFLQDFKLMLLAYIPRILGVLFLLAATNVIIKALNKLVKKLLKRTKLDPTLHNFICAVLRIGLWVVSIVAALLILQVPTSPLVTVMGSAGLALSLALKDSLANVAGGISVLAYRPFAIGDLIEVKGVVGIVTDIELFYTYISTDDGKMVYLPNGDLSKSVVTNYSTEPLKRLKLEFFIPLQSDFTKAKDIIAGILESSSQILTQPAPIITIKGSNDDSYMVSCKAWTKAVHFESISQRLGDEIDRKLKENGI